MKIPRILENAANSVIIILALTLGVLLLKNYFSAAPREKAPSVGDRITVVDIDFTKADHNLMIALRSDCHFCQESRSFYQSLIRRAEESRNTQIVAVFADDSSENASFLDSVNPHFPLTKNLPFEILNINATPTIVDVNRDGVVASVWIGKLSDTRQNELLEKLH